MPVSDSVSAAVSIPIGTFTLHGAFIVMTSTPEICTDVTANVERANQKYVTITLSDVNGTSFTTPTAPGTYSIYQADTTPPPKAATLDVGVTDGSCNKIEGSSADATSGTVVLESVSGNVFKGTFNVVLNSGDTIKGSFDPEGCAGIQASLSNTTPPTCR